MTAVNMRRSFLKGHGLRGEGRPFHKPGCAECEPYFSLSRAEVCGGTPDPVATRGYGGHGYCSCGEYGPCDDTAAARKRWHREHKDSLR